MRKSALIGAVMATWLVGTAGAHAAASPRSPRSAAIRLFRPLAEAGNPTAQNQIGVMYRKGEGVIRSPARAFMWFSLAAKRGDTKAKAGLRGVSKTMTPGEISQAQQMAQACEASNYRACEY